MGQALIFELYKQPTEESTTAFSSADASSQPSDDNKVTIEDKNIDMTAFVLEGFSEPQLDLSLSTSPLSSPRPSSERPPSPTTSSVHSSVIPTHPLPAPPSSTPQTRRIPSSRLSPMTATSLMRSSWPMIRYIGRGTPIDRNRRLQWGGAASGDEVGEDGLLFSGVRPSSLDSALYPSRRSVSSDWHMLPLASAPFFSSPQPRDESDDGVHAPETEIVFTDYIQVNGLSTDPATEWESFMQDVLQPGSAGSSSGSNSSPPIISINPPDSPSPADMISAMLLPDDLFHPTRSEMEMDSGIEMDLRLDSALDLGLGIERAAGINWFSLRIQPASGRTSPSVYSTPPSTPHGTLPQSSRPSLISSMHEFVKQEQATTSMSDLPWWKTVLGRCLCS